MVVGRRGAPGSRHLDRSKADISTTPGAFSAPRTLNLLSIESWGVRVG